MASYRATHSPNQQDLEHCPHQLPVAEIPHPFLSLLIHGKANIIQQITSVHEKRKQNIVNIIIITFPQESNILHHSKSTDFFLHSIHVFNAVSPPNIERECPL